MVGIFRGYDIRGVWGRDLTPEVVERIGNAISKYINSDTISIGRDVRCSSHIILEHLRSTISQEIIDLGIVTTPITHFSTIIHNNYGAMITASHNPGQYNGIKLIRKGFDFLRDDYLKLEEIYKNIEKIRFYYNKKYYVDSETFSEYIESLPDVDKKLKIVYDPGNSVGYILTNYLKEKFDLTVINKTPDGSFPGRPLDPSKPENIKELLNISKYADYGFALDGDGDRVSIVRKGSVVSAGIILYIIAKYNLKPGDKVVMELMLPLEIEEKLKDIGIKVIRTKTGHIHVKKAVLEQNAKMFGEYSGHFGFNEFYYIDDGLYTFIKFVNTVIQEKVDIDEELRKLNSIYEARIDHPTTFSMEDFVSKLDGKLNIEEINTLDGYDIRFGHNRIIIRKSNTESLYRIKIETNEYENLNNLKELISNIIKDLESKK